MVWGLVLLELIVLWFSSRYVFQSVYNFLTRIGFRRKGAIYTLAFLFLPGTIVHELAHMLTAEVLGVRTGNFTVFPQEHEGHIKMGSVQVQQADPVRSFLIGIAPILLGIVFFVGIFFGIRIALEMNLTDLQNVVIVGVGAYILFVVINTMFSSKKDIEACLEFIGLAIFIALCIFFFGKEYWGVIAAFLMQEKLVYVLEVLGKILLFPLAVNSGIMLMSRILR